MEDITARQKNLLTLTSCKCSNTLKQSRKHRWRRNKRTIERKNKHRHRHRRLISYKRVVLNVGLTDGQNDIGMIWIALKICTAQYLFFWKSASVTKTHYRLVWCKKSKKSYDRFSRKTSIERTNGQCGSKKPCKGTCKGTEGGESDTQWSGMAQNVCGKQHTPKNYSQGFWVYTVRGGGFQQFIFIFISFFTHLKSSIIA